MTDGERLLERLGIPYDVRGDDLWGPCPNPDHQEREPSWHIKAVTGVHHCFGCHFSGGPAQLVMTAYGFAAWASAFDWLREQNLFVDQPSTGVVIEHIGRQLNGEFVLPVGEYIDDWARWPEVVRYYAVGRGIEEPQVARWRLLFAASGRLAGRVVFPFRDQAGRLKSYSARSFTGSDLRFLTPHADEGSDVEAMFGPEFWPARNDRKTVVVTEGAIDGMACERAGAPAIAALSGSNLTGGHFAALGSFDEILIATDRDKAGERVAEQLMRLARWKRVGRVDIMPGYDCASIAFHDRNLLAELIEDAKKSIAA